MATAQDDFGQGVLDCMDDINCMLPRMSDRFSAEIIVSALGQHVSDALKLLLRRKMCAPGEARRVLRHIQAAAFAKDGPAPRQLEILTARVDSCQNPPPPSP